MPTRRLPRTFFARPTLTVARDMIGKILCRRIDSKTYIRARITEVEAYRGENDSACHAARGRTKRTEPMYARPGTIYVYLIYGMYHCLNIVTEQCDFPAAVLIRGCKPLHDSSCRNFIGPGRLCKTLDITVKENGGDITHNRSLWISDDGTRIPNSSVIRTPRVGVEYAGEAATWNWRFVHDT